MKSDNEIVVLGAGGFSTEIIEASELSGWHVLELYADDPEAKGRVLLGKTCLGSIDAFERLSPRAYVFAMGDNQARQRLGTRLAASGHRAIAVIHPTAIVSPTATIGGGAYIAAGVFIGPRSIVGQSAIINVGASIGHDAIVGDFAQVCPGARISGFARLGVGSFAGSNSVLGPKISLGDWAKLGAASFAARDVPAGKLAIGVPAKTVE